MLRIELTNGYSESFREKDSDGKVLTIQVGKFLFQMGIYKENN